MATLRIAEWASAVKYTDLPPDVISAAIRSFYNWAGCAIGGSSHPTTQRATQALSPLFGKPTSTLLGTNGQKADASHAALINGIASHVHDYDDTHLETIIHPTGPVASAMLAYAEMEGNVTGKDFITALVVGIEVECKLGLAVWPKHYDIGWHITSTTGVFGAAAAVSRLMRLDPEKTMYALGVAATQVTGIREMFGTDAKAFHCGRAAQNGLMAAMLASEGFTSSTSALEAKRGWVNIVGNGSKDLDNQVGNLGKTWETAKNTFKPFPCGIVVHPVIDACIQLHNDLQKQGRHVGDIARIHAAVHPLVLELTGKKTPQDGLQAKFSVYHGGAVGLVLDKATPKEYETEVVLDEQVISVRDKIEATVDENLAADETIVEVEFEHGGEKLTKHVKNAVGSLKKPLTDDQLQEKFLGQVASVLGQARAKEASDACWKVVDVGNVSSIASACC